MKESISIRIKRMIKALIYIRYFGVRVFIAKEYNILSNDSLKSKQKLDRSILRYLKKEYGFLLNKYNNEWDRKAEKQPKAPVWVFWWQGEIYFPEIIKVCQRSREIFISNHQVILLTKENIKQFVCLDDLIWQKFDAGELRIQHLADIVRVNLLRDYGGLWLDASVFCTKQIPEDYFNYPIYSIRKQYDPEMDDYNVSLNRWTTFVIGGWKNNSCFIIIWWHIFCFVFHIGVFLLNKKVVLSIIIPLYNGEKFIERTVNSILSQPSIDYEIIIVDDGSVDYSINLITELAVYSSNIQIISIKNRGVGCARNLGIEFATGMYYLFVDQDDLLLPDSFNSTLVNRIKKYYSELVDVFSFRFLKSNASVNRFYTSETSIEAGNAGSVYMISGLPIHFSFYHSKLFKKDNMRFEESRYVDLDMQLMHMLYYRSCKIKFDNNLLLYCWVIHQESAGHNGNNLIPKHYDAIRGWKELADIHKEEGDTDAAEYCHSYMCGVYLSFLREYYKTRFSSKPINTLITDLDIEDDLKNFDKIDNQSTVDGLSEYYSQKCIFIIKSRLEKYKHFFGLFAVNRIKYFNNRYMTKKYPLTDRDLHKLNQTFVEKLCY